MSMIYLGDGARVKTYSTKARAAGGAVISVEFEATSPSAMSFLLHQIEEIRAEQKAADKAAEEERRRAEKTEASRRASEKRSIARREQRSLAAAAAPLLLSYRGDRNHD